MGAVRTIWVRSVCAGAVSGAGGRAGGEIRSSAVAHILEAVTQRRRKSGRVLTFSRWRLSSSTSWRTRQRLVPGLARRMNCGLSTNDVCIRSPPAQPSSHAPLRDEPQNSNCFEPSMLECSCFVRCIELASARAIDAIISKRIVRCRGCAATTFIAAGISETRLTSASAPSSVIAASWSVVAKSTWRTRRRRSSRRALLDGDAALRDPPHQRERLLDHEGVVARREHLEQLAHRPLLADRLLERLESCASSDSAITTTRCSRCRGICWHVSWSTAITCAAMPWSMNALRFAACPARSRRSPSTRAPCRRGRATSRGVEVADARRAERVASVAYSAKSARPSASITHGSVR